MVKPGECDSHPQRLLRGRLGGLRGRKWLRTLYHNIWKPAGETTLTGLGRLGDQEGEG